MDDAFLICGHGGEHRKTFIVPKGCIIIVHVQYGEKIDRAVYLPMIAKLHRVNINVLRDPLAKEHLPILLQIYKRFTVYQEGEECPDFRYQLFDCLSSTRCNVAPMGVIDMRAWDAPPSYERTRDIISKEEKDIIKHFSHPYHNSIIPTEQEVKDKVKKIIDQHTEQAIKDNVEEIIKQRPKPLLRAIFEGISEMTNKTLSELCVRKGVYYHTLCRQKGDVTKALRRNFPDIMTLPSDIKQDLIKRRRIQHRPIKNIITLRKEIEKIERLPLSHTRKKANNAIARKRGMIDALTYRIGETITHRTPFIKHMMNSPVYQSRRREEVKKEIADIDIIITYYQKRRQEVIGTIEKKEKHTRLMHIPTDTLQELEKEFTRDIKKHEAIRNNLIELEASMDASSPPPLSYVQENTRWKLDPESYPESHPESHLESYPASPYENTHQHIMEAERYGKRHIRNSYTNHLHDEREQLRQMREAHARFKKGRNEYMEANAQGNRQGNRQENEKDMKGYEKEIKRLEYLTNVVPPFHTSRVKIDKNKQLQEMRNAHARFTTSRKKYMNNKASDSNTNQYKKNMNYFNRVLRGYEKGIHDAENPSDSYTRVNKNGTIKWVRK
jgi:hypothetical protein